MLLPFHYLHGNPCSSCMVVSSMLQQKAPHVTPTLSLGHKFAVVETIESAYASEQQQRPNFTLSSQQLISCDTSDDLGLYGCREGVLESAFNSLKYLGQFILEMYIVMVNGL